MNNVKAKVVGITRGTSKKGAPFVMLNVNEPFVQKQTENGSVGMQASSYFLDDNLIAKVDNSLIGKEVTIYTVFTGKSNLLCDIQV